MAIQRRAHGVATAWTTSQPVPYSTSQTAGDACYLAAFNTAAIGTAPAGWVEKDAAGPVAGYYCKVFRLVGDHPGGTPTAPTITASGGTGGVAWIEHYYSDASMSLDDSVQILEDTDTTSTAFSATGGGSSWTLNANDLLVMLLGIKTVSTMTAGPTAITITQPGATMGTQVGNFGARLVGASPTNSLHYGGYQKPATTGGTGTPTATATSGTGGGNAGGMAAMVRLREVAANTPPTANAGSDQTVTAGNLVTLNGTGSTDSDGTIASYTWTQISGTAVTLSSSTAAQPTFTPATAGVRVFGLTVTDNLGATSSQDTVQITVNAGDTANAGSDQTVAAWDQVTLTGTGSATGAWSQVSGPAVTLGGSGATRTFEAAPSNTPGSTAVRVFRYTVGAASDDVAITTASGGLFFGTAGGLRAARQTFA